MSKYKQYGHLGIQFIRSISSLTLAFFLVNQGTFANPGAGIEMAENRELPGFFSIDIPAELASLDGLWEAPPSSDSRVVLHIQNAHANYGAQKKIKELLEYLNKTYAIKTIFVEGAVEDLNPDYLKLFPDKARNLELADLLAQQGELTGAELYLLETNDFTVKGKGIEDAELYRHNYEALKKVFGSEALVDRYLHGYESRLDAMSSKVFTNDLRRVLADWQKFEKGHREFMPYVRSLAAEAKRVLKLDLESLFSQVEWPQITRLLVLQGMEKDLDTAKALEEKDKLISFLKAKNVSPRIIAEVENFKEQRLSVRQGQGDRMQPRDVLGALVKEAGPKGFYFRDYPAFSLYAGYLILKSELDAKGLFEEIKVLFEKILDSLAVTSNQKALLELYRDEELVRKLLRLELSRRDWQQTLGRKAQLGMDPLVSRLKELNMAVTQEMKLEPSDLEAKKLSPKFREQVLEIYDAAFSFYEFAHQRESMFYEKINAVMSRDSSNKAVLITGGFHTDGMTDLFREHNISYGVLTPRLIEKSDEKLYRNTMLQNEKQLFSISYLEMILAAQSLSDQVKQGSDVVQHLSALLAAFRSKLPKDHSTGKPVADEFNKTKPYGITLEYAGTDAEGRDSYKIIGLEKVGFRIETPQEGVTVPVARSEARVTEAARAYVMGEFRRRLPAESTIVKTRGGQRSQSFLGTLPDYVLEAYSQFEKENISDGDLRYYRNQILVSGSVDLRSVPLGPFQNVALKGSKNDISNISRIMAINEILERAAKSVGIPLSDLMYDQMTALTIVQEVLNARYRVENPKEAGQIPWLVSVNPDLPDSAAKLFSPLSFEKAVTAFNSTVATSRDNAMSASQALEVLEHNRNYIDKTPDLSVNSKLRNSVFDLRKNFLLGQLEAVQARFKSERSGRPVVQGPYVTLDVMDKGDIVNSLDEEQALQAILDGVVLYDEKNGLQVNPSSRSEARGEDIGKLLQVSSVRGLNEMQLADAAEAVAELQRMEKLGRLRAYDIANLRNREQGLESILPAGISKLLQVTNVRDMSEAQLGVAAEALVALQRLEKLEKLGVHQIANLRIREQRLEGPLRARSKAKFLGTLEEVAVGAKPGTRYTVQFVKNGGIELTEVASDQRIDSRWFLYLDFQGGQWSFLEPSRFESHPHFPALKDAVDEFNGQTLRGAQRSEARGSVEIDRHYYMGNVVRLMDAGISILSDGTVVLIGDVAHSFDAKAMAAKAVSVFKENPQLSPDARAQDIGYWTEYFKVRVDQEVALLREQVRKKEGIIERLLVPHIDGALRVSLVQAGVGFGPDGLVIFIGEGADVMSAQMKAEKTIAALKAAGLAGFMESKNFQEDMTQTEFWRTYYSWYQSLAVAYAARSEARAGDLRYRLEDEDSYDPALAYLAPDEFHAWGSEMFNGLDRLELNPWERTWLGNYGAKVEEIVVYGLHRFEVERYATGTVKYRDPLTHETHYISGLEGGVHYFPLPVGTEMRVRLTNHKRNMVAAARQVLLWRKNMIDQFFGVFGRGPRIVAVYTNEQQKPIAWIEAPYMVRKLLAEGILTFNKNKLSLVGESAANFAARADVQAVRSEARGLEGKTYDMDGFLKATKENGIKAGDLKIRVAFKNGTNEEAYLGNSYGSNVYFYLYSEKMLETQFLREDVVRVEVTGDYRDLSAKEKISLPGYMFELTGLDRAIAQLSDSDFEDVAVLRGIAQKEIAAAKLMNNANNWKRWGLPSTLEAVSAAVEQHRDLSYVGTFATPALQEYEAKMSTRLNQLLEDPKFKGLYEIRTVPYQGEEIPVVAQVNEALMIDIIRTFVAEARARKGARSEAREEATVPLPRNNEDIRSRRNQRVVEGLTFTATGGTTKPWNSSSLSSAYVEFSGPNVPAKAGAWLEKKVGEKDVGYDIPGTNVRVTLLSGEDYKSITLQVERRSEARETTTPGMMRDFSDAVAAQLTPRALQWLKAEHVKISTDSLETLLGGIILPADAPKLGAERVAKILTAYAVAREKGQFSLEVFLKAIQDVVAQNPAFGISNLPARTVKVLDRLPESAELASLALQLAMNTGQEFPYVFIDEVKNQPGWQSFQESVKKIQAMKDALGTPIGGRLSFKTVNPAQLAAGVERTGMIGVGRGNAKILRRNVIILWGMDAMPDFEGVCTVVRLVKEGDQGLAASQNLAGMKGAQTGLALGALPAELVKELPEVFKVHGRDRYFTMENDALRAVAKILSQMLAQAAVSVAA